MKSGRVSNMDSPGARLNSLDALRGLDMLIILGIDSLVYTLYPLYSNSQCMEWLRQQMGHAPWDGLRLYDCVFPLFVYMAGLAMFFSLSRRLGGSPWRTLGKLWKRALILVLLGFLINGSISWDLSQMRCASVLGLIGISGAISGSLLMLCRGGMGAALLLSASILGGVGAAQYFGGDFTPDGSFNAWVDARYCPGRLHSGNYDPEGPLCILSATALNLLGYATGRLFMLMPRRVLRVTTLLAVGGILLAAGWFMPIIKGMWTPGFVLCTAGIGAISISLLHLIIDVLGWQRWSLPLRVVGLNALAAYVVTHLVSFHILSARMLGGTWGLFLPADWVRVANAAVALLLGWLLCWFLYRKRVFIKL